MSVYDLVKASRSYRGYNSARRVTREELLELVECARLCPSSVNKQPLKYYLAWESDETAEIQRLTRWAKALPDWELPRPGECPTAFIVICQDLRVSDALPPFQKDVGIAAQTMLLAAAEKGLGGCCIGSFDAGEIRKTLGLPTELAPVLVVAFGEPSERVVLTEVGADGRTAYYRDADGVHYVPKRRLEDIVLTRETKNKTP